MDDGFYSADYLRAWIRAAQLRAYLRETIGSDWWQRSETGDFLRGLFAEGTRPSSDDIAARIGFEPLDTRPLVQEQLATP
jgi:GTP-dependent phosphoenolpyruvate carboxykinase